MKLGAKGEALIKSYEKLRLVGYLPTPHDKPTAGWGHTGPDVEVGKTYTLEQAQAWFAQDTQKAVLAVISGTDVPLTQNAFDALVSFTFNVGVGTEHPKPGENPGWLGSTLRKMVNARYTGAASAEFGKWNKQGGIVLAGLTARREAERQLFLEA